MLRITLQSYSTICVFTQSHKNTSGFHMKEGHQKCHKVGSEFMELPIYTLPQRIKYNGSVALIFQDKSSN